LGNIFSSAQAGKVEVVKWDSGSSDWVREGAEVTTEASQSMTGYSVSLNGDGTTMIIGYKQHPGDGKLRGRIEIYEFENDSWHSKFVQNGDTDMMRLGHAVVMNRDGNHAAASGANEADGIVYHFDNEEGVWTRNTNSFTGAYKSSYGNSLSASSDGSIFAVAAWKDIVDIRRGQNGVVRFNSPTDDNIRPSIRYSYPNGMFGASVSLSADASIVAIGTNSFLGGVYVYSWDETTQAWNTLKHIPISTTTALGRSVSLSASGTRLLYVERTSRQLVVVDYVQQR
jgi:hypothetical protein